VLTLVLFTRLAFEVTAGTPVTVKPFKGPVASVDAFCAAERTRMETDPEWVKERDADVARYDNAEARAERRKEWSCSCKPDPKPAATTGKATPGLGEVRTFTSGCSTGAFQGEWHAGIAVKVGDKWWTYDSDIDYHDQGSTIGGLSDEHLERRMLGKLPALVWQLTADETTQHDYRQVNQTTFLVVVAVGASGRPSATEAVPIGHRAERTESGGKSDVWEDSLLEPRFDAAGASFTLSSKKTVGLSDEDKARLGKPLVLSFP
jgi:hypothetical protein